MGAFDDLIPQRPAATPAGTGLFDDLVPNQPAAPDPAAEASLGERFRVNAREGFEGTLLGQGLANWQASGGRSQAETRMLQDALRQMDEQSLDTVPASVRSTAGTPLGLGEYTGMGRDEFAAAIGQVAEEIGAAQAAGAAERAPMLARREQMPAWHEEEGMLGKLLAGATALTGQLAGGAPSPESLLAFGRGANVLGRARRGAAGGAAGAAVAEPVVQEQELRRGEREDTSVTEGAFNVALGAALGGVLNVTPDMARGVRRLIADRLQKPEAEVTPEDVQAFDPEELMRSAQAASDAATLDPESLEAAIRAGAGTGAPPRVGEGLAPQDARRARRDRERELGAAFETTDVLRREDVQPGEEGLDVREGAEPLRDPTGEHASPDSYGARSTAARTAQEMGVTLDENGIRLAARDIQADPSADPRAIVRSYSQEERGQAFDRADIQRRRGEEYARDREGRIADFEAQPEQVQQRIRREYANRGIDPDSVANAFTRAARQGDMRDIPDLREEQAAESRREFSRPAFEAAERRRQRREEDLATGERVGDQASTYRTAEEPYERQGQREVTLIGARRNKKGQLTGGEAVEVLAYAQRQMPNGKIQDMARIVRGDEDPVWVPASQLETVTTPENPRMYGEALSQTREPPRGVMTGRGDSPAGFDASQTPEPRRAVDRQADPDGLRRGLYSEAEPEPGPEGPGPQPRAEETFDGYTGRPYREADTTEMTPQGTVRTEFQGEGGEMPITRTRRPVRETSRPQPTPEERAAWEQEPEDVEADFREMTDEEMDSMFEAGTAQPAARPDQNARTRQMVDEDIEAAENQGFNAAARRLKDVRDVLRDPATMDRLPDDRRAAVQREMEMYARRVREGAQSPDGPLGPRARHTQVFDDNIRREQQEREDHDAAERREFEGDTGIAYVDDVPYSSDQRTSRLGGAANEWYAGWLGRGDLIKQDVGLRGLKETIANLQREGFLSPTERVDQDVLTNMDPATRQRLFDTMDEMRRRSEGSAKDEREAWQKGLGRPEKDLLRVIDTWRENNPGSRGTQTAQPQPTPAQPAATAQGVNANAPERLAEPEMAQALRDSKQDFGWAERGGELIRDTQGKPVGRTRWLPHNEALMDAVKGKRLTREGYGKLVDRALDPNGKPLTNRQRGIVDDVLDAIDPRAQERAEAEAEADADAAFGHLDQDEPDFDLTPQTEKTRQAEEQRVREAEAEERRRREEEDARIKADKEADDFNLTGSNRPADVAAAGGQMDLTNQPASTPRTPTSTADELRALGVSAKAQGTPEKTLGAAREALRQLDTAIRDGSLDTAAGSWMKDVAERLGIAKSGKVSELRQRLTAWRRENTDAHLREAAQVRAQFREGQLTPKQAYERGLIARHPKVFPPPVRALVRDTGNTGKPDWQKTLDEYLDARGNNSPEAREIQAELRESSQGTPYWRSIDAAEEAGLDIPQRVRDSHEKAKRDLDATPEEAPPSPRTRMEERRARAAELVERDLEDSPADRATLEDALATLRDSKADRGWTAERRKEAMRRRTEYIDQVLAEEKTPKSQTPIADKMATAKTGADLLDAIEPFLSPQYRPLLEALRQSRMASTVQVKNQRMKYAEGAFSTRAEINTRTGEARITDEVVQVDLERIRGMERGDVTSRLGDDPEASVAQIMLHELTHAATTKAIRTDVPRVGGKVGLLNRIDAEKWSEFDASEKLEALRRKLLDKANDQSLDETTRNNLRSAGKDTAETVAWGMTNPEVQAVLKNIPALSKRHGNLFRDFIDAIREALGLGAKHRSALTDLVEQAAQLMVDADAGKVRMFSGDRRVKSVQSIETQGGGGSLDKITAAVKRTWGGETRAAREAAERIGQLTESSKEALGGSRAKNRATKRSPFTDLWRVTLASLDGDLRTLVGKFDSPTLKSLPDIFHATAGRGDAVTQTFDEAVQARNNPRLQEVDRIVSAMREAGIHKPEQQERIIRLIENPRAARQGKLGEVATRIDKFLKQELDYLRKAGVNLGEVRDGYFPREMDTGKAAANPTGFIRAATRAYREMGLPEKDAKASAEAYWEATVYGASGKPGAPRHSSQTPSFVQSRVFTKAAAKHMEAFRVRDIDAVLGQYVMRATKRGEIARRFGDNWEDWGDIEAKIKAEDPNAQDILPLVRDRVAMSAGVNLHGMGAAAQHSLSMVRTWTTLATLPKAAMSSVGELVIAPWRGTTGSIPGDLGQNLVNLWAHIGNFSRTLTGLGRNEQLQASFELAEDIGIIAGTGHNNLMAARFAGGDPVGRVQSEVLASFFRRNLLEGLTNYTRVTSMQQGQVFLRRLGKQMERHPGRTGVFLRELGVPRGEEAAFAAFVRNMGDDFPTAATVTGPYAGVYRNALQRFTDQTVMRPSSSTRPKYASHPLGAVIFQLQAFAYSFQKNVLNRQARLLASKDLSYADKLAYSAATLPAVALLVGLQGMMRDVRDRLYDSDVRERKTTMAHLEGAVSQAGLLGVADPYLQSLTGIRYQRNPLASLLGPAASGLAETTMVLSSGALNNSDETNTGERNLAKATYDWLLEPAAQAALTAVPGGPVTGKLGSALTIYAVPKGRDTFTTAVAGAERPRRKPPIQGTIEWLMNGPASAPSATRSRGSNRGNRGSDRGSR